MPEAAHGITTNGDQPLLHVDQKKSFERRLAPGGLRSLSSPLGSWAVDCLVDKAPWRPLPPFDPSERASIVRLAVGRAFDAVKTALARGRGAYEAKAALKDGHLGFEPNIVRLLQVCAAEPSRPLEPLELTALLAADSLAWRLGIKRPPLVTNDNSCPHLAQWLQELREELVSAGGRPSILDLNAFFQTLVRFWDINMTIPAASSRQAEAKSRRHLHFHAFAEAAAEDAGCNKVNPRTITSAVVAVRARKVIFVKDGAHQLSMTIHT